MCQSYSQETDRAILVSYRLRVLSTHENTIAQYPPVGCMFCLDKGHREGTLKCWNRGTWNDEPWFRLLSGNGILEIQYQVHEIIVPACQIGTAQGYGGSDYGLKCSVYAMFRIFGICTNIPQRESVCRVAGRSYLSIFVVLELEYSSMTTACLRDPIWLLRGSRKISLTSLSCISHLEAHT